MTKQEIKDFKELSEFRKKYVELSKHEDYRNQWELFIKLYSDEAHFVYELLQNADDANATRVEFILSAKELIFKHNGTKRFTVTNPYNKPKSGHGDINAITAIAHSNKNENINTIGKFGIGFKAVFQYTDNPSIYDENFFFRIRDFIVPEQLDYDHNMRGKDETLFEFPFDKKDSSPEKAYKEISSKLKSLDCPLLFLPNLKEIIYDIDGNRGNYEKKIEQKITENNTTAELIKLIQVPELADKIETQELWLFSRKCEDRKYSVGYFLDNNGKLKPIKKSAFCFFSTKMNTGLNFIIHAPFLLSGTREGILASDEHNLQMIKNLADLAADALVYLRDFKLIDDNILNIIPVDECTFKIAADQISFEPFFIAIQAKMREEKLLPTKSGYVSKENAYWAEDKLYAEVFSDRQLQELVGGSSAAWVFTSISRSKTNDEVKKSYIDDITHDFITEENLFRLINEKFIENQSSEWFQKFYEWLAEPKADRISVAKYKPFFLNKDGKATAAFDDKGRRILFLPNNCGCPSVHPDLLTNSYTEKFLKEKIGIREPSLENEVYIKTGIKNPLDLDETFIEDQTISWLHRFYKWIAATNKIDEAKIRPFFLDENLHAVAAFKDGKPILFLPNDGGYPAVHSYLLANPDTEKFLKEKIGINKPSLKDEINTKIKPNYQNRSITDDTIYFKKIFFYYERYSPYNFIFDLKNWLVLRTLAGKYVAPRNLYMLEQTLATAFEVVVTDKDNPSRNNFLDLDFYLNLIGKGKEDILRKFFSNLGVTDDINDLKSWIKLRSLDGEYAELDDYFYMPEPELIKYFDAVKKARNSSSICQYLDSHDIKFLDLDFYLNLIGKDKESILRKFFNDLGVANEVRYLTKEFTNETLARKFGSPFPRSTRGITWTEGIIHGCITILEDINKNKNRQNSVILWKRLLAFNEKVCNLSSYPKGRCDYFYYSPVYELYTPATVKLLKNREWLVDKLGNFKKPSEISVDDIANDYGDLTSENAKEVIAFLDLAINSNLTDEQKILIDLGQKYKEAQNYGIDVNKLIEEEIARRKREEEKRRKEKEPTLEINNNVNETLPSNEESPKAINNEENTTPLLPSPVKIIPKPIKKSNRLPQLPVSLSSDDFKRAIIDYGKELEKIRKKSTDAEDKIKNLEKLQQKILDAEENFGKYSFGWCKALLELEILSSNENKSKSKAFSISFGCVERDKGTPRTLILKYPNRCIPQSIEDLENIPLNLRTIKTDKKVMIEVAGIRHNTLSVKLKDSSAINEIDLKELLEARIDVTEPFFLLEELQKQFNALNYSDDYDMQQNLCKNIDFVFGPPGTGKTTNLSNKIIDFMRDPENKKILVLTPTNKAADVLINKIIDKSNTDKSYLDWLLRFGTTDDSKVEKSGVFHEKNFDINSKHKNVTVTTIARFSYDFFMVNGRTYLYDIDWDYIIFDEASMITLAQILLPLYKKTPKKFIVAGDPFQIDPITESDLWKGENIYTLVGLNEENSFTSPKTIPNNYSIETLTTQYRSVPTIGEVFSKFSYGGKLNHARENSSQLQLNIEDWFPIKTLNIIKFPVDNYESIYRSRRLNSRSPYHVYSALLTFEFVKNLSERIKKENFSIGIVAPYRAQADLIEKLFSTVKFHDKVDIQIGTVHTFQGDECDILLVVFNTPPSISSEIFLNRRNIINVAISRARDYLFLIVPDDETIGVDNLQLIKEVEDYFADSENEAGEFSAQDIENLIFGESNYIEKNSFTTGHQSVNVYSRPERKYEIRSENNAVDVQLHEKISNNADLN